MHYNRFAGHGTIGWLAMGALPGSDDIPACSLCCTYTKIDRTRWRWLISNFGFFASPERKLVIDLNDFDECTPGPWEWVVKRLAASVGVAARENGMDHKTAHDLAQGTVEVYGRSMSHFTLLLSLRELDIKGAIAPARSDEEFSEMSATSLRVMWQQYLIFAAQVAFAGERFFPFCGKLGTPLV